MNDPAKRLSTATFRVALLALAAAVIAPSSALAIPVNIDFSTLGLAEGQSYEGQTYDIATFTSENASLTYTNDFGAGLRTSEGSSWDVYVNFAAPVSSISVRAGDGAGDNDAFALSVYAFGTDAFLGTFSTPLFGGAAEPEWYTLNLSGLGLIGRVVFDPGNSGVLPGTGIGNGGVIITDLNFDTAEATVPEPGGLTAAGLLVAVLLGRRAKRLKA